MRQQSIRLILGSALLAMSIWMAGCSAGTNDTKQQPDTQEEALAAEEEAGQSEDKVQMPSFTAKDLDGNTVTEDIFGEKDLTVLNIWGTFCGPCIGEMPELGEWAKEMPDNVQIVGLIIDIAGDEDTEHHDLAVDIVQKADAEFTHLIANSDFAEILKDVFGVPTTIFVDKDGNIVGDSVIGADVAAYKKFVEDYLDAQ